MILFLVVNVYGDKLPDALLCFKSKAKAAAAKSVIDTRR